MRNEQRRDDVRNLMLIGVSALVAVGITASFVTASEDREVHRIVYVEHSAPPPPPVTKTYIMTVPLPLTGEGRLYGRVSTRNGGDYTGFIRWDRNEGSWADLLDANKEQGSTRSGIRFGHIQSIDVHGRSRAELMLRSGQITEMSARSSDLGTGLRALVVEDPAGGTIELGWGDLARVEFLSAPADLTPSEGRLYGTLTTSDGQTYTGDITWDVDEIYTSDLLEGDNEDGRRMALAFGEIASISRNDRRSARVVLNTGGEMILDGTNDVDSSIRGISVSDPQLGEVKVGWGAFREVQFHGPDDSVEQMLYDGGRRLHGTVTTRSGEEITGDIRWDDDEQYSWEILNGYAGDAELQVELGRVARIARQGDGAMVELRDGRTMQLTGSNDVDSSNRGIVVELNGEVREIDWSDFVELRLQP